MPAVCSPLSGISASNPTFTCTKKGRLVCVESFPSILNNRNGDRRVEAQFLDANLPSIIFLCELVVRARPSHFLEQLPYSPHLRWADVMFNFGFENDLGIGPIR